MKYAPVSRLIFPWYSVLFLYSKINEFQPTWKVLYDLYSWESNVLDTLTLLNFVFLQGPHILANSVQWKYIIKTQEVGWLGKQGWIWES